MENTTVEDADCRRLYELIWRRTMACQMSDAELERTIAKISISTNKEELTAQGEVLKFDGFLKVYMEDRDEEDINEEETPGRHASTFVRKPAIAADRNEGHRTFQPTASQIYRGFPGEETGRTGYW